MSGRRNKSYSNSPTKSARPRLPVSNAASKHRWPRFALPECPGGRMMTRLTLPRPPSPSLSSESVNEIMTRNYKDEMKTQVPKIHQRSYEFFKIIGASVGRRQTTMEEDFAFYTFALIHATKLQRIGGWYEHHFGELVRVKLNQIANCSKFSETSC